jgi:hypothetical protein
MSFDLGRHVKARNRSVSLGTSLLFLNPSPIAEPTPRTSRDSRRSTSLPMNKFPLGQDDQGSSQPSAPRPSPVRHQRSMLDVDADSRLTLNVIAPMSFYEQLVNIQQDGKAADQGGEPSEPGDNRQIPSRSNGRFTSSEYSWSQDLPPPLPAHSYL